MHKFNIGDRVRIHPTKRHEGGVNPYVGEDRVYTIKCTSDDKSRYYLFSQGQAVTGSSCRCPSEAHCWVVYPRDIILAEQIPPKKSTGFAEQFTYIASLPSSGPEGHEQSPEALTFTGHPSSL